MLGAGEKAYISLRRNGREPGIIWRLKVCFQFYMLDVVQHFHIRHSAALHFLGSGNPRASFSPTLVTLAGRHLAVTVEHREAVTKVGTVAITLIAASPS